MFGFVFEVKWEENMIMKQLFTCFKVILKSGTKKEQEFCIKEEIKGEKENMFCFSQCLIDFTWFT